MTQITVKSSYGIYPGDIVLVGGEEIRVTSVPDAHTLTVRRLTWWDKSWPVRAWYWLLGIPRRIHGWIGRKMCERWLRLRLEPYAADDAYDEELD